MEQITIAQDVIRCDVCKTAVVQMHCDTCLVNLCTACVGNHMISDEPNDHKVVKFQSRKFTPLYPGCTLHDKEKCEIYCNPCGVSICSACIASGFHSKHIIFQLFQIYNDRRKDIEREMNEMMKNIFPTYENIVSDAKFQLSQLEKEYGDLLLAITKQGVEWHREIDKLVEKLRVSVFQIKTTQVNVLNNHLEEIEVKINQLGEEIKIQEKLLESNKVSLLLEYKSRVEEFKKIPAKLDVSIPHFTAVRLPEERFNEIFGKLSSPNVSSNEHGYSLKIADQKIAGTSPPVKHLLDEPKTVNKINTGYDYLHNVACQADKGIWTRGDKNIMKLFSMQSDTLLKSVKTKSGENPTEITVTQNGDLVFIDSQSIYIEKNYKLEELIRLENWRSQSVCSTSNGDLLVFMLSDDKKQSKVIRYSGSLETQVIQFDDNGELLYRTDAGNIYISENRNLDVCVAERAKTVSVVVVVNQAGKLRFRYTGHISAPRNKSFDLRGITTDSQSHILSADNNNNCVHVIDRDGQFICFIICANSPWGLCTDSSDNLFVVQTDNKKEKIFKIRYMYSSKNSS